MAGTSYMTRQGGEQVVDATLITRCCSECSVIYAIPTRMYKRGKEHGTGWHCPNGHFQSPIATPLDEQLEEEKNRRALATSRADRAEASAKAQRAAASRARNERDRSRKRHAAGVCPCCNRSFKQLRRHMASKHPDYEPAEAG